jgi:hypothetical protein
MIIEIDNGRIEMGLEEFNSAKNNLKKMFSRSNAKGEF